MLSSLVVLTDFSAVTNRALAYSAALALPLRAQLVLLHVLHDGLLAPSAYNSRHTRQGERKTLDALQILAAAQPVPAEVDVSEDFLPDAVQEAVRRHHPLLVVLGRPGTAYEPSEIVTSTAMDLLHHAACPLLVVPTVGLDACAPPHRVLLAVDGESFRLYQQQQVLSQLLAAGGTLDVVHVRPDNTAQPGAAAVLQTIRANKLAEHLEESCLHEVCLPSVVGGVLQEADRQKADLLVVVARRHSLLGGLFHRSVTAQLVQECPIPVLVLPAED